MAKTKVTSKAFSPHKFEMNGIVFRGNHDSMYSEKLQVDVYFCETRAPFSRGIPRVIVARGTRMEETLITHNGKKLVHYITIQHDYKRIAIKNPFDRSAELLLASIYCAPAKGAINTIPDEVIQYMIDKGVFSEEGSGSSCK